MTTSATDPEATARAAFDAAVSAELRRLEADPATRQHLAKRRRTILALASADCDPLTTREDVWRRKDVVRKATWFARDKTWGAHPLMADVLANVTRLTREFEAGKTQRALEAQRAAHNDMMLDLTSRMVQKSLAMLDFPLAQQRVTKDGVTVVEPANWSMSNVASLATAADKIARLALDMSTQNTAADVTTDGQPLPDAAPIAAAIERAAALVYGVEDSAE